VDRHAVLNDRGSGGGAGAKTNARSIQEEAKHTKSESSLCRTVSRWSSEQYIAAKLGEGSAPYVKQLANENTLFSDQSRGGRIERRREH